MTEKERLQKALDLTNEAHALLCLADDTIAQDEDWASPLVNAEAGLESVYGYINTALDRVKS